MSNLIRNPNLDAHVEAALRRDEHGAEIFSTIDVPANLRNTVWEARNRSHLIGLKAGSPAPSGVMGTMRSAVVNGLSIADITGNAHTVERTPAMIRHLRSECVVFTFVLSGESFHFTGTSPLLVKQGEVAAYDSDKPFLLGFSEGMHAVVASLPRYHLADVGLEDAFRSPKVLRHTGSGVECESTRRLLDLLVGAFEPPSGVDPHEYGETFVGNALHAVRQLSGRPQKSTDHYYTEAKAFIDGHLSDPNLSVGDIAVAMNLSQRHLSRIFSRHDTTVATAIQQRRLHRARALLTSPEGAHMTAAEVARRSGFTSPSHFSRVFHSRFGMSPTEARRGRTSAP